MFSKIANSAHWPHIKYDRSRELQMALARHKSRRVNAVSIPLACEVCREEPVTTLVADFIFADLQASGTLHYMT